MKRLAYNLLVFLLMSACASNKPVVNSPQDGSGKEILGSTTFPNGQPTNGDPFQIKENSSDKTYGYKESNPIKVGAKPSGPLNERRFLNALAGPNGETIQYNRVGSCCPFNTKNSAFGQGLLDKYEITWEGQAEPVYLFINMYDQDDLKIPVGFSKKK